jgi:hypothetical protein
LAQRRFCCETSQTSRDATILIFTATQNVNLIKKKPFAEKASKHAADLLFPLPEVRELCEASHLIRCNVNSDQLHEYKQPRPLLNLPSGLRDARRARKRTTRTTMSSEPVAVLLCSSSAASPNHSRIISPAASPQHLYCTVLCRTLSMPPYHSHHQPRGSSNITKQSSTTSSASLCAYARTRIHSASSNKGIESETPPAAPEGSPSPA